MKKRPKDYEHWTLNAAQDLLGKDFVLHIHTHVHKYIYAQSMWKKMKNNAGLRALSSATRNENEAKVEGWVEDWEQQENQNENEKKKKAQRSEESGEREWEREQASVAEKEAKENAATYRIIERIRTSCAKWVKCRGKYAVRSKEYRVDGRQGCWSSQGAWRAWGRG